MHRAELREERNTPAEHVHDAHHLVHFYQSDESLFEIVADFLVKGAAAGDPLIVIATEAHRDGFDVDSACAAGRLVLLDAREMLDKLMVDNMPDWERFVREVGGTITLCAHAPRSRVRAYGEMVDLLWRDGNSKAAIRLEEMWNDLARTHPFTLLCAYVLANFYKESNAASFQDVCMTHTHVIASDPKPIALHGHGGLRPVALPRNDTAALNAEIEQRKQIEKALRDSLRELRKTE